MKKFKTKQKASTAWPPGVEQTDNEDHFFENYRSQQLTGQQQGAPRLGPVLYPVLAENVPASKPAMPPPTQNQTQRHRKTAVLKTKSTLVSHSPKSLVKRAVAGIQDDSSPYNKTMYQEKQMLAAFDKYILAKSEATDGWSTYMKQEENAPIKSLYENICQLDKLWIKQQQKYRVELPEQRRLFKQLMKGENEINKLKKHATEASTKVTKNGKLLDETLAKNQGSSKALDMKKLENLQNDLAKSIDDNEKAQKQYAQGSANHKKFKYNQVRKMATTLAEVECQMHKDIWRLSEAKLKLCNIFMGNAYSQASDSNIHRSSCQARDVVTDVYRQLGMTAPQPDVPDAPPQTVTAPLATRRQISEPSPVIFGRALPSAPPSAPQPDTVSINSNTSSWSGGSSSVGVDLAETEACYNGIEEYGSDEDEPNANYIYEFEDGEFDEPEVYENVEGQDESQTPNYLDLMDDRESSQPLMRSSAPGAPRLPPRQSAQPPIRDSDIYEESDISHHFPSVIHQRATSSHSDDLIFGQCGSYQRPRSPDDVDEEGGTYGRIWESQTAQSDSSSGVSSRGPSREGSLNSNPSNQRGGRESSTSMIAVEESRYTSHPGSRGEQPAPSSNVRSLAANIALEAALKNSLATFQRNKDRVKDAPPPLPPRR